MRNWPEMIAGERREGVRHFLFIIVISLLLCSPGFSVDRYRTLTQFRHTSWTAKDGAPSQISALAQTLDGYLWIGSARGIFKFDGVEFTLYEPPTGMSLPGLNVIAMHSTHDGGLWVAFRPFGLAFIKGDELSVFSLPEQLPKSEIFELAQDAEGRLWAATLTGLALYDGSRWIEIGSEWNLPNLRVWSMFSDREGTFWVSLGNTIAYLPRGSRSFQLTGIETVGVPDIAQGKDGRLWRAEWGKPVRVLSTIDQSIKSEADTVPVNGYKLLFDRLGSIWILAGANGIKRLRFNGTAEDLETFTAQDGLTDNTAGNILEDREGNIWISSTKGLDRFSYSPVVSLRLPPTYVSLTLLAEDNGELVVASTSSNPLLRLTDDRITVETDPIEVTSFCRDPRGLIWWGSNDGIWRQNKREFKFFPQPIGADDWFWEIFPADETGGLWAGLGDRGIVHFKDGAWDFRRPDGLRQDVPSASFKDPDGKVWLGYNNGEVALKSGNEIQNFSRDDGIDIGRIKVIRGRRNHIWLGGEAGLIVFQNGSFRKVNTESEPFGAVAGIVETEDGSLWLSESHGIVHIPSSETRMLLEDPDHRIVYRLYDILDGMPGGSQINTTVSAAVEATDGRIWFATDNGLAWIDPTRQETNPLPPPVLVKTLTTDARTYQPNEVLELPKGTETLRISYTALSLSVPERVRFKYQLEGIDHDWWDAGNRREAFFTNLGPGEYRFRVIASNNDGVWNEEGAVLEFAIMPMFYQTNWFLALCAATLVFLAWLGYRFRLRQLENVMRLQLQERLAERTRIAQDLHDTLLQGFVGAKMQLYAEVHDLPPETPKAKRLKGVYEMMGELIEEGRGTVRDLRDFALLEFTDFEREFMKVAGEFDTNKNIDVKMIAGGTPRPLHPLIGTELLQIGQEALVNALLHSSATAIEIEIEYGSSSLKLSVRDNGRGIDPGILSAGREGHWGLTGMRERAEKIKAEIRILSRVNAGTEVVVSVPRRFAYKNTGSFFDRVRRFMKTTPDGNSRDGESKSQNNAA